MTRIKICCIKSIDEAERALTAGADALGLVAAMPSGPGVIDDDTIRAIATAMAGRIETFLLTSETEPEAIITHAEYCNSSTVQIVSHIEQAAYRDLRAGLADKRLVQVIHVEDAGSVELACHYANVADALLLDSGRPSAATPELGGTGRTHDWQLSAEIVRRVPVPVYLAGGMRADNVADAIRQTGAFGIDLCSGVRSQDALDDAKLQAFMIAARG